jgi:hypothetical protein
MNDSLQKIHGILETVFGAEGASLLVDDVRLALATIEGDDREERPGRRTMCRRPGDRCP